VSNQRLVLHDPQSIGATGSARLLGRQLIEDGHITTPDLVHAIELQSKMDAQLGEILVAEGLITPHTLLQTLATQANAQLVDLEHGPPRINFAKPLPATVCLQYKVVPCLRIANTLLIATSSPLEFEQLRVAMGNALLTLLPVVADPQQIQRQITRLYGEQLAQKAITQVLALKAATIG
tara:strand:+ start:816 stop:1352 length:537 start_codon:yes stop_codon:yes gene_type:complete